MYTGADAVSMSDAGLVRDLPSGSEWSEAAFRTEYERHRWAVYAVSCRLCGPELATDVTQEVFLRLWARPDRFDPSRGTLRALLLTMARGATIDRIRSENARKAREGRIGRQPDTAQPGVDNKVPIGELRTRVARALEVLNCDEREAIIATFYGGCTYREAAAALGVPEGTLKSRIRRALHALRAALADPAENAVNGPPIRLSRGAPRPADHDEGRVGATAQAARP